MQDNFKLIRVFVASPNDVTEERNQLPKVIQEINQILSAIAPEKKVLLDLIRWETNIHPDMGRDGQGVVNAQLPDYDIFIGIMWQRFGTPTAVAGSGTEEEFNNAYAKWQQNDRCPIMFYFCQHATTLPGSLAEIEQLKKVIQFKERISNRGLIWDYSNRETFADVIRPQIVMSLRKVLNIGAEGGGRAETAVAPMTPSDRELIHKNIHALSEEYNQIRSKMLYSGERTRLMSVVETKMRSMALQVLPILPELAYSGSPGERLAAIATLKEVPDVKYLEWLVNRVGKPEKDFVGFHAALALQAAAQTLVPAHREEVLKALTLADKKLKSSEYKDPNQVKIIESALGRLESNTEAK